MKRDFSILDACADRNLFGLWFKDRETWAAGTHSWPLYSRCRWTTSSLQSSPQAYWTAEPPGTPQNEAWLVVGRRGGKSFKMALIATYLATSGITAPTCNRANAPRLP